MRKKSASICKRQRSKTNSPVPHRESSVYPPSMATPCRMGNFDPLAGPTPCAAYSSRSVSVCTGGTEGLSDDSVFLLDIGAGKVTHYCIREHHGDSCGVVISDDIDPEASQWQRELNEFFARLDQRPLYLAP